MDYSSAQRELERGRNGRKKIANNTYLIERPVPEGSIAIRLHNTDVVTFRPDGSIQLNSGGWRTYTTKERINYVSGIVVYQKNYEWFVVFPSGNGDGTYNWDNAIPFEDGMVIFEE